MKSSRFTYKVLTGPFNYLKLANSYIVVALEYSQVSL